jgi:hypothetical protein
MPVSKKSKVMLSLTSLISQSKGDWGIGGSGQQDYSGNLPSADTYVKVEEGLVKAIDFRQKKEKAKWN